MNETYRGVDSLHPRRLSGSALVQFTKLSNGILAVILEELLVIVNY